MVLLDTGLAARSVLPNATLGSAEDSDSLPMLALVHYIVLIF